MAGGAAGGRRGAGIGAIGIGVTGAATGKGTGTEIEGTGKGTEIGVAETIRTEVKEIGTEIAESDMIGMTTESIEREADRDQTKKEREKTGTEAIEIDTEKIKTESLRENKRTDKEKSKGNLSPTKLSIDKSSYITSSEWQLKSVTKYFLLYLRIFTLLR